MSRVEAGRVSLEYGALVIAHEPVRVRVPDVLGSGVRRPRSFAPYSECDHPGMNLQPGGMGLLDDIGEAIIARLRRHVDARRLEG